jgi:hypothetical protein
MVTKARIGQGLTTVNPDAYAATDFSSHFRPRQYIDGEGQVRMQKAENDPSLLTFMNKLPANQIRTWDNPLMSWNKDTRSEDRTQLKSAVSATDTYIRLDEPKICEVGYVLYVPQYNSALYVEELDDDFSEGWTNDASDNCNVRVSRTKAGGPQVAIPTDKWVHSGPGLIGETGSPKKSLTTTPGNYVWNAISLAAHYFTMSNMQKEAYMRAQSGDMKAWGTFEKEVENLYGIFRRAIQRAMLFGHRGTTPDDDEGVMWQSAGLVDQYQQHVLDVGALGNQFSWATLNDFWEGCMDSDLGSKVRDHFAGSAQFRDMLGEARVNGRLVTVDGMQANGTYYDSAIGSNTFTVNTESGGIVNVHEEKHTFVADLADWGITVDGKNIENGYYAGMNEVFLPDISNPSSPMIVSPAILGSWGLCVIDDSTGGVIRGGIRKRVNR